MRIAQVAPLFESVPPRLYGGTERVVSYLTEELVDLGHDVTLFASGDSVTSARLVPCCGRSLRLDESCVDQLAHQVRQMEEVFRRADDFDVIHFHTGYLHFPLCRRHAGLVRLTTMHGRLDLPDLVPLFREFAGEAVLSISDAQREPLPWLNWQATIHHGIPSDMHRPRAATGRHLVFVGRLSHEKRPDAAIRIATRFGMPLKIAAKLESVDRPYFDAKVRPLLDHPLVEWVGEVDDAGKDELLGGAYAFLFPIDWPEPFGLVAIEAMACGTPVIAFSRGAVPEIIEDGVTGFIVPDEDAAVRALARVGSLDRRLIRARFDERFHASRMARDHIALFETMADRAYGPGRRRQGRAAVSPHSANDGSLAAGPATTRATEPEPYSILATASLADENRRVLKQGDTFAVFDHYGDVTVHGLGEQGLFHEGTRYLSRFELRLERVRPLFLSSTVKESNDLLFVDLANPDIPMGDGTVLPRGTIHVFRAKLLWEGACHERLRVSNHGLAPVSIALTLGFDADFADIFEVRGNRRERRGDPLRPEAGGRTVRLAYRGLDGVVRRAELSFSPAPAAVDPSSARFDLSLPPQESTTLTVRMACQRDGRAAELIGYDDALTAVEAARSRAEDSVCRIRTSSEAFNEWLDRSASDLRMMTTATPHGPYPYAGVPWFSTPFGRDGIVTAMEVLWMDPSLARGVLAYLAATQADALGPEQDAEPGKILHETRGGEMAALGEVPFGRYYGSVDATPLFVMLAGQYLARTADHVFAHGVWPAVERALAWMDRYGDRDGDGFIEYARRSPTGLVQQGWKDSGDSVFHADGRLADGPIAICEVQGYAYAARHAAAAVATTIGRSDRAHDLLAQAEELRRRFEAAFWMEDLGTYALALDGEKRPCRVRASNAGHCLFSGIAHPSRAARLGGTLMDDASFSGWGIRTLSAGERRYNPMSYHNGSIWPHDNALIGAGLGRYGLRSEAVRVLEALFEASGSFDLRRMPELFCGFKRRPGEGPTRYPVACAPQAWAAGAVFLLLQAALGLTVDATGQQVLLTRPQLPAFLSRVWIENLRVGESVVDLALERHATDVGITVTRREGPVEIVSVK